LDCITTFYYFRLMGLKEIQEIKANADKPKPPKQYSIPKKSAKRIAKEAKEKEERGDNDTELVLFFKRAMKRMSGECMECFARTETKVYQYAIFSICHILEKRPTVCPSVAYNLNNWIELCPDHHHKFDRSNWEERETWGIWPTVREKLILLYDDLDPAERRFFPPSVLAYMEKHSAF